MFSLPGRKSAPAAPTPAAIAAAEMQRIDRELRALAAQPRNDTTLAAMDFWLDRRLGFGSGVGIRRSVPVIPGGAM
jgi:hypothetical protein